jgi:hypothetical protein
MTVAAADELVRSRHNEQDYRSAKEDFLDRRKSSDPLHDPGVNGRLANKETFRVRGLEA